MRDVTVETGCRLHLGLVDFAGSLGRLYGGVGVYLSEPGIKLSMEESDSVAVSGTKTRRFASYAKKFLAHHRIKGGARINVLEEIPPHAGLGSGTQTALAVSAGIARLYGIKASPGENSVVLGRGRISALGTHLFKYGGFVLEGGHTKASRRISPMLARYEFPEKWGFVVVIPATGEGLSGKLERNALKKTVGSVRDAEKMSHIILMKMLPALAEEDLDSFGAALYEADLMTGSHFKAVQGGSYRAAQTESIINFLMSEGAKGCGQSSWGPAVYALTEKKGGTALARKTRRFIEAEGLTGSAMYAAPRNRGASVCY